MASYYFKLTIYQHNSNSSLYDAQEITCRNAPITAALPLYIRGESIYYAAAVYNIRPF